MVDSQQYSATLYWPAPDLCATRYIRPASTRAVSELLRCQPEYQTKAHEASRNYR